MVKQRGVTIVSLVVTIILLIILAGVSISAIWGENGIITIAKQAKENVELAQIEEQAKLNELYTQIELEEGTIGDISNDAIEKLIEFKKIIAEAITDKGIETSEADTAEKMAENIGKLGSMKAVVGKIVTDTNKTYTKNGTAVIPVGFAIVPGLDDVSEGLVISDVANDTGNTGNQFVWIPVDKATFATKFKRTAGYFDGSLQNMSIFGEANAEGTNAKVTEDSSVSNEARAMYASVEANGGFYIGRYEAGTTATSGSGIRGEVVVKKNKNVYNNIGWSNSNTMTNVVGGAVEVARGMYDSGKKTTTNENYGVVSTLCYGVQWDAALNFIDSNYITNEVEVDGKLQPNCAADSYLVTSAGKGWYSDNYSTGNPNHLTGIDVDAQASNSVKNIYDMAGNVIEWTMESNSSLSRVYRGRYLR